MMEVDRMGELIPARWRRWAYGIGTAVVPLLVTYGVVSDSAAALWLGLLAAIVGGSELAMAAAHTPTRGPGEQGRPQPPR